MKTLLCICLCLLPTASFAATLLADCDDKPYTVIVRNGGQAREVTISKYSGEIEEFGPVVSFQIKDGTKDQPIVKPLSPDQEFCIWNGRIQVQRMNTGGGSNAPGSFR